MKDLALNDLQWYKTKSNHTILSSQLCIINSTTTFHLQEWL